MALGRRGPAWEIVMTSRTLRGAALAVTLLAASPAGSVVGATDANIVTAIDISDSVAADEMRAQIAALAGAIRSPDFLAAVRRGQNGRVAVAVFVWHHQRYEVLPWTPIGSIAEAEAAARVVETRVSVNVDSEARASSAYFVGRPTDLSRALDHAGQLLAEAGTPAGRGVVNVLGNGRDNMGEPAAPARSRLLDAGITVNGVVFGGDPDLAAYYRSDVAGGAGAFVITAEGPDTLAETMRRKLLRDLVAGLAWTEVGAR